MKNESSFPETILCFHETNTHTTPSNVIHCLVSKITFSLTDYGKQVFDDIDGVFLMYYCLGSMVANVIEVSYCYLGSMVANVIRFLNVLSGISGS